jgi:hypothetical protein
VEENRGDTYIRERERKNDVANMLEDKGLSRLKPLSSSSSSSFVSHLLSHSQID